VKPWALPLISPSFVQRYPACPLTFHGVLRTSRSPCAGVVFGPALVSLHSQAVQLKRNNHCDVDYRSTNGDERWIMVFVSE
jgi:hypothetical protein